MSIHPQAAATLTPVPLAECLLSPAPPSCNPRWAAATRVHTPLPLQRLKELQAEAPSGELVMLRIEVEGGGCSGFQYVFRLDSSTTAEDRCVRAGAGKCVLWAAAPGAAGGRGGFQSVHS